MAESGVAKTHTRRIKRAESRSPALDTHDAGPLRVLLGNRAVAPLVFISAGVTLGKSGSVTAQAVDALLKDGTIAGGLVDLRLFIAAASRLMSPTFNLGES